MRKTTKQKTVLYASIVILLLSSLAYISLLPITQAAEITNSQRATNLLENVVGLKLNAYATVLTSDVTPAVTMGTESLSSGLSHEILNYDLKGSQGSLKAHLSFIDGSLNMLYLSDYENSPPLYQPTTNTIDMAKGFLERYQTYTGNSLYGSLSSTLDIVSLNVNMTKTSGNVKLQISSFGNET